MNDKELVVAEESATAPLLQQADVEGTVAFFDNYDILTQKLLKSTDYQRIGKKEFKKKSAWRKYGTAFNLTDRVLDKEIIRDEEYHIISARYEVEVSAPNGRKAVGVGSCSIFDKISNNDTVEPSNFELRKRFSNAEHDIISTAHTRAKSRAISDIIGTGEVSSEEMGEHDVGLGRRRKKFTKKPPVNNDIPVKTVEKVEFSVDDAINKSSSIKEAVDELETMGVEPTKGNLHDKLMKWKAAEKINDVKYNALKKIVDEITG